MLNANDKKQIMFLNNLKNKQIEKLEKYNLSILKLAKFAN